MEDYFKLGVVIPYYRTSTIREVLMKELVQNIQAQIVNVPDVYVCIYEDGSNSSWLDKINNEHIHILRGDCNKGISYARNRCIDYLLNIGCNYMVFVDSDDFLEYDYFNSIFWKWIEEPRLYYFTDFDILGNISPRVGLKERVTGIIFHKSLLEYARFDESIRIAEDVDFNDRYMRDKLTEPYYIDTTYHYNFGIDKHCLSYQAIIERGDRLETNR